MERERIWGWKMSEMKAAGNLDQNDVDALQDAGAIWEPSISGFTPINQRAYDTTTSAYTSNTLRVTMDDSTPSRFTKRRKSKQSQLTKPNPKPKRSVTAPRQAKVSKARKGDERHGLDVSQALRVTKPGIFASKSFSEDYGQTESTPESQLRTSNGSPKASCPTSKANNPQEHCEYAGLGQSYQAAFKGPSGLMSVGGDPYAGTWSRCAVAGQSPGPTSDNGPSSDKVFSDVLSGQPASSGPEDIPRELVKDGFRPTESGRFVPEDPAMDQCAYFRRSSANLVEQHAEDDAFCFTPIKAGASEDANKVQAYCSSSEPASHIQDLYPAEYFPDVQACSRPDSAQAPHFYSSMTFLSDRKSDPQIDEEDDIFLNTHEFRSDDTFDEVLESTKKILKKGTPKPATQILGDPFQDDSLDDEFMNLDTTTAQRTDGQSPPFTQCTPTVPKLQWMPPTLYTPSKRSTPSSLSTSPTSPDTPITRSSPLAERSPNVAAHIVPTKDGRPVPFVRPSFPKPLLPRSPVMGVSQTAVLRTCFRIGEALNAASVALRNSTDAIVELYCRVKYSDREPTAYKQLFELVDLFTPDKAPSLDGQYAIWKGVDLWEHDSRQFLAEGGRGKKARVIGRIKRGKKNEGWEIGILSVWQVDWEDIGIAKGVVCL